MYNSIDEYKFYIHFIFFMTFKIYLYVYIHVSQNI